MLNLTQTQLTELAEQKPDEFVQMIKEICMGWDTSEKFDNCTLPRDEFLYRTNFNPLDKTERGRSQAFELAHKYGLSVDFESGEIIGPNVEFQYEDIQPAICIAAILTAQGIKL